MYTQSQYKNSFFTFVSQLHRELFSDCSQRPVNYFWYNPKKRMIEFNSLNVADHSRTVVSNCSRNQPKVIGLYWAMCYCYRPNAGSGL